jgi:recombinational DNA repair ATPase RecF
MVADSESGGGTMSSSIADGVMAATHKLVQQAMTGQWQDVPKTVAERRLLLNQLSAAARPQDQQWLSALQQAMAESDAAVEKMRAVAPVTGAAEPTHAIQTSPAAVEEVLGMIRSSR